jgi:hypothetical protein
MSEEWEEQAVAIGKTIRNLAGQHRELMPLATSFINFARKRGLAGDRKTAATKSRGAVMGVNPKRIRTAMAAFDQAGLVVIDREDYEKLVKAVDRQSEEIEALELRIKRLTERH